MKQYNTKELQNILDFIQQWFNERDDNEELYIHADHMTIINEQQAHTISLQDIAHKNTLLERCKQDLQRDGSISFNPPSYLGLDEESRINALLKLTQEAEFKKRKPLTRLETFYYLGEVLNARGWQKKDIRQINKLFCAKKSASNFRKTARRVYELFNSRGLANLYTVEFIRPHHLLQLSEEEFYEQLIPEARKLRDAENELLLQFAGAHTLSEG
jgi:hypothetical protein